MVFIPIKHGYTRKNTNLNYTQCVDSLCGKFYFNRVKKNNSKKAFVQAPHHVVKSRLSRVAMTNITKPAKSLSLNLN